jgi:hypothetical protein
MSAIALSSLPVGVFQTVVSGPIPFLRIVGDREVYVYARDTTTEIAVFADEALTAVMDQPLQVASDGIVPGYVADHQSLDILDIETGTRMPAEAVSGNPTVVALGTGQLFVSAGALMYRGGDGTVTTVAPA